jgi:S-DNA-T family DNA segregation ATPase FtsK/SpoIIIE
LKILVIIFSILFIYFAFSTLFYGTQLAGEIGDTIAMNNLNLFGNFAYINIFILFYPLYRLYKEPNLSKSVEFYAGWLLFFISTIILPSLIFDSSQSGILSLSISSFLLPLIGKAGLWLFWLMIVSLAFVLVIDDDWSIHKLKDDFYFIFNFITRYIQKLNGSLNTDSVSKVFNNPFNPTDTDIMMPLKEENQIPKSKPKKPKSTKPKVEPKKIAKPKHIKEESPKLPINSHVERVEELEENSKLLDEIEKGTREAPKNFKLPKTDFLQKITKKSQKINEEEIDRKIGELLDKLGRFKIEGDVVRTYSGPLVTTFEFKPAPNVKVSKILNLQDDLAMALSAETIRIQAPIPGRNVIGIEIPNESFDTIYLREILESKLFKESKSPLTIALGKDIVGRPFITDLKKLPHLLIAGTTGSGKSVGINAMILSLLYRNDPDELKLVLIDPKMLEFSIYNDIPHLLTPVIIEAKKAISALANLVLEMERRYKLMAKNRVKNIENYNDKMKREYGQSMPYIVIIIDELADLMMNGGKEVEYSIARLAQMARASGMHLIVATQRPSVDVVTGLIKANLPSRLSYRVGQRIDSKVILDSMGAESLLGRGDALFTPPASTGLIRLHAPWNTEVEVEAIVEFLKSQRAPDYDESYLMMTGGDEKDTSSAQSIELDSLYEQAKDIILEEKKTSISYLQRKLQIGYNRSANIIDQLEKNGILTPPNHKGNREIV